MPTRSSLARFEVDHPGTQVGGREIVQASEDANAETQAWVGYVLLGLVIVFCTFAVFNTLMLAISERGREFGLLRLVGGTRRQVVDDDGSGGGDGGAHGPVARCCDRGDHRDAGLQSGHRFVSTAHAASARGGDRRNGRS